MDAKNNVRAVSGMLRTKAPLVLICAALAGAMILIFARGGGSETTVSGESVGTYYSEELERRVDELVLSLAGIDRVTSIVTLDGSGEYKYAKNERIQRRLSRDREENRRRGAPCEGDVSADTRHSRGLYRRRQFRCA